MFHGAGTVFFSYIGFDVLACLSVGPPPEYDAQPAGRAPLSSPWAFLLPSKEEAKDPRIVPKGIVWPGMFLDPRDSQHDLTELSGDCLPPGSYPGDHDLPLLRYSSQPKLGGRLSIVSLHG